MAAGLVIIAGGVRHPEHAHARRRPYVVLAVAFAVLGAGMGITAAPATGEIMSAVPLSKAGVGSAVNDTTRELGGALGIAILGSVATSAYRSAIDAVGARTRGRPPPPGRGIDRDRRTWSPARSPAATPSERRPRRAFTDAFVLASVVSVAIVLAAAAAVWFFSRTSRPDGVDEIDEIVDDAFELGLAMVPAGVDDGSQ